LSQSEPEEQESGSPLAVAFRALSQGTGVYQENLFTVLGDGLPALWHIAAEDDEWMVRVKVVWQLERLISHLPGENEEKPQETRTTARVRFNLLNLPGFRHLDLERRVQGFQRDHKGPSESTSGRQMRKLIIPSFEAQLSQGPMPPVPDAVLAVMREARPQAPDERHPPMTVATSTDEIPREQSQSARPHASMRLVAGTALLALLIGGSAGWLAHAVGSGATSAPPGSSTTNAPPPSGPTGTGEYQETAGSGGARTYEDPHTVAVTGPSLTPYQQVTVACKIFAPVMPSVGPGWWYRITSPPWNGRFYAPANSFMNGDPVGVDMHHVDEGVKTCP